MRLKLLLEPIAPGTPAITGDERGDHGENTKIDMNTRKQKILPLPTTATFKVFIHCYI
jgi:hypothetical protein